MYLRETMKFTKQTQGEGWISLSVCNINAIVLIAAPPPSPPQVSHLSHESYANNGNIV